MEACWRDGPQGVRDQEKNPELQDVEEEELTGGGVHGDADLQRLPEFGVQDQQHLGVLGQMQHDVTVLGKLAKGEGQQDVGVQGQLEVQGQHLVDTLQQLSGVQDVGVLGQLSGVQDVGVLGQRSEMQDVGVLGQLSGMQDVGLLGKQSEVKDVGVLGQRSGVQDVGVLGQLSGVQDVGVLGQWSGKQDVGVLGQLSGVQDVGVLEQHEECNVFGASNPREMLEAAPEVLGAPCPQESRSETDGHQYATLVNADTSAEAQDLEISIEEMLIRLDEFCAMMDMIRSETSLILDGRIPAIKLRVEEMNKIYCQVEKLEAFVKMVGHHVSYLEEELIRAERDHISFPCAINRVLAGAILPVFLQRNSQRHSAYELPALYRTEDYFPASIRKT